MKPRFSTIAGLGSTSALLLIATLGLAGYKVPFGAWLASELVLLAVGFLEAWAMWNPAKRSRGR